MKLLIFFFVHKCAVDIAVTGPLLQTKAKETAQGLHIKGFQASIGWLPSGDTAFSWQRDCMPRLKQRAMPAVA
jgi:hypothetical protein